ncbi:translation elongation factor P/transcription antitermination factor NusB [Arthrobacter woluwensis]|nr:translation elongation factor P/transcription antitermination factor NusB [Arthrobacter woluwensis]
MATTNDIKNGTVLKLEGNLWNVIEFQHVKPGKGGAFVRTKLRNILSGKVVDKTFNAGAKIETATVDRRDYTYLYQDGADYVFMDVQDYDQLTVTPEVVGNAKNFMLENQQVIIAMHDGSPLYLEMPASVVLEITYTEPGLQGDRSLRRHQARHRGDRLRDPGPAVPRAGHPRQGRHPRRQLPGPGHRLVSARGKARNRALDILFEAEQRQVTPFSVIKERREHTDQIINPYTVEVVEGVVSLQETIDEFLTTYAQGWTLERMPNVDRIILRIGTWELLYNEDVPDSVAVSEAVSLAKTLSTDDSPAFINGLLGRLKELKPTLLA